MKILILCDSMGRGGAETHILTLASSLAERGHRLSVASGGGALTEELSRFGVGHIRLPLGSHNPFLIFLCRLALSRMIRSGGYDVVHSHSRLASFVSRGIAKRARVAFVTTAHARFEAKGLKKRLSAWGATPIAVSEDIKQYLVDAYSLSPENITVIPNGADSKKFFPMPSRERSTRIIFLSRMDADCALGARILCRIAPALAARESGIEIALGGRGSEYAEIRRLASKANERIGYECVRCVGEVSDSASFLRSGDIFVGVSRAAIEASLCGASVVLCGNEGYLGRLGTKNFALALSSNFCARGCDSARADLLLGDLETLLGENKKARRDAALEVREYMLRFCDAGRMASLTEKLYLESLARARNNARRTYTLICGYYGFGNMGDDALLRSAIRRCRREFERDAVHVLSKNGRRDSERFGVECKKRSSLLRVISEIRGAERVVLGGGTLLQSSTSRRSMLYYSSLCLLARLFGKECLLWGNGIGRCEGRLFSFLCRLALRSCTLVETRDGRSYCLAKYFSSSDRRILPTVVLGRDLAEREYRSEGDRSRTEYLLCSLFGKDAPPFVVAAPRDTKDIGELARLAGALAREAQSRRVLLVPMFESEDLRVCEAMAGCGALGAKILRGICFDDLVDICRRAERVYSMRLHGLVAARLAGTECVAIGSDVKLLDFIKTNPPRSFPEHI